LHGDQLGFADSQVQQFDCLVVSTDQVRTRRAIDGMDLEAILLNGFAQQVFGRKRKPSGSSYQLKLNATNALVSSIDNFCADHAIGSGKVEVKIVGLAVVKEASANGSCNLLARQPRADDGDGITGERAGQ
jgi:hypothetical protein